MNEEQLGRAIFSILWRLNMHTSRERSLPAFDNIPSLHESDVLQHGMC